ncbi:MAG TPA: hypothetical protein VIM85_03325 [Pseudomonadales bacterium]
MKVHVLSALPTELTETKNGIVVNAGSVVKLHQTEVAQWSKQSLALVAADLLVFLFYSPAYALTLEGNAENSVNALTAWKQQADAIVQIQSAFGKPIRVILVDHVLLAASSAFEQAALRLSSVTEQTLSLQTVHSNAFCAQALIHAQGLLSLSNLSVDSHSISVFVPDFTSVVSFDNLARLAARQVSATLTEQPAISELKDENELLLLQLMQVQEELERYYTRCKQLEAQKEQLPATVPPLPVNNVQPLFFTATAQPDYGVKHLHQQGLVSFIRQRIRFVLQRSALKQSLFFDANWYLDHYPDVKEHNADPVKHYFFFGAEEGRDPGPKFSTRAYIVNNPDVAEAGINPLVHYELFGRKQNRSW